MTTKELAAKLNGREIGEEMTIEESMQAKADGLLVIFGASDDLIEFRGAIIEPHCTTLAWYACFVLSEDRHGRIFQEKLLRKSGVTEVKYE